jgi:histidinol-phosphate aminotransferase
VAALKDTGFVEESYRLNQSGMQQLSAAFDALGLEYVPSFGNFVLVKVGDAERMYQELLKRGVIVRPVGNYGLPEWLRVTVGLPEENKKFIAALAAASK